MYHVLIFNLLLDSTYPLHLEIKGDLKTVQINELIKFQIFEGFYIREANLTNAISLPKTDKRSPKPPTTTTLKPKRRKPSTPKSQTRKPTTQKPLQDYEDYDYDYDYYNEPSPTTTTPKPPQRKTTTHTSPKTKGTLVLKS